MYGIELAGESESDKFQRKRLESLREIDRERYEKLRQRTRFIGRLVLALFIAFTLITLSFPVLKFFSGFLADKFSYLALGRWYFNFVYSLGDTFRSAGPVIVVLFFVVSVYWAFNVRRWLQKAIRYPLAYGLLSATGMTVIWIALFSSLATGFIDARNLHIFNTLPVAEVSQNARRENVEKFSLDPKFLESSPNFLNKKNAFLNQQEIDQVSLGKLFVFLMDNALIVVSIDASEMLDMHVSSLKLNNENGLFVFFLWVFRLVITFTVAPFYISWSRLLAVNAYRILFVDRPKNSVTNADISMLITSMLNKGVFRP